MCKYRQENGPGQYTKFELDRLLASCECHGRDLLDDRAGKSYTEMTVPEPLYCTFPEPHTACSQVGKASI